MSLSTRLDKLESAMRGRDNGDPPDVPWLCRRLIYDPRDWGCTISARVGELSQIDRERIYRIQTDELDRLVAAGEIREIDREHVRFIVRVIVDPPKWPDDPRPKKNAGNS
jgi:hypothetical protein